MSKFSVGGQALIEGILMRGRTGISIVLRKQDGDLHVEKEQIKPSTTKFWKLPLLRGLYNLGQSMRIGIRALNLSAKYFDVGDAEEEKDKFTLWMEKVFKSKADDVMIAFSMIFALLMSVGLFIVIPTLLVSLMKEFIDNRYVLSAFEGILKMVMFLTYILLISKMKEVHRVFQYHGAEHKAIHCYESGEDLTVENARKFTTLHPRCGTSYIFFVLAITIVVFSFVSWASIAMRLVLKLLFLPVIAGVSYEVLKFSGTNDGPIVRVLRKPGLWIQKITTAEPDDGQLEVALVALKEVL